MRTYETRLRVHDVPIGPLESPYLEFRHPCYQFHLVGVSAVSDEGLKRGGSLGVCSFYHIQQYFSVPFVSNVKAGCMYIVPWTLPYGGIGIFFFTSQFSVTSEVICICFTATEIVCKCTNFPI